MTDHSASPDLREAALNAAWKELIAEALRRNVVVAVAEHRAAVERAALQSSAQPEPQEELGAALALVLGAKHSPFLRDGHPCVCYIHEKARAALAASASEPDR